MANLLNLDHQQMLPMVMGAINLANQSNYNFLKDSDVNGANTYATLLARVTANMETTMQLVVGVEQREPMRAYVLRGLDYANRLGTFTDARLNGLTTVAQLRTLIQTDAPNIPALTLTYAEQLPG